MDEYLYKTALFILIIAFLFVRGPFVMKSRKKESKVMKSSATDRLQVGLSTLGMMVFPVIFCLSPYFDGFMMNFVNPLRIAGIFVYAASLVLMFLVLRELGGDWSMNLELKEGHRLVVSGPYRYVRHPMYTSFCLMMAGQFRIVSNWFVGIFGIASFGLLYVLRIPKEERMMEEEFGNEYRVYSERTKRLIPFLI